MLEAAGRLVVIVCSLLFFFRSFQEPSGKDAHELLLFEGTRSVLWCGHFCLCVCYSFAVENLDHCDFSALRNMLIRTHMQDLIDTTDRVHFEGYRFDKLASAVNPSMQAKASTAR